VLKKRLLDYYLNKKMKNLREFLVFSPGMVLFVLWMVIVGYYKLFEGVKHLHFLQAYPVYSVLGYLGIFVAHGVLALASSRIYQKQDVYFYMPFPVPTSLVFQYMVTKHMLSLSWLPFFYALVFLPIGWYSLHAYETILLLVMLMFLAYGGLYESVYVIRSSWLVASRDSLREGVIWLVGVLLLCVGGVLFMRFLLVWDMMLMGLVMVGYRRVGVFLSRWEREFLILLDKHYIEKKRKPSWVSHLLRRITGSRWGIIFFEFVQSEIFQWKNGVSILAGVVFLVFSVLLVVNYPLDEEARRVTSLVVMVVWGLSQLVLSGILESRVKTQHWFFYRSLPISFIGKFLLDYVPYLVCVSVINVPALLFILGRNWQLGWSLCLDSVFMPFLTWHISFMFMGKRLLGSLVLGGMFVLAMFLKMLSGYGFVGFVLLVIFVFVSGGRKRYLQTDVRVEESDE